MTTINLNTDWMEPRTANVARVFEVLSNKTSKCVLDPLKCALSCGSGRPTILVIVIQCGSGGKVMMEFTSMGVSIVNCPEWLPVNGAKLYVDKLKTANISSITSAIRSVYSLIFPECNYEATTDVSPMVSPVDKSDEDLWQEIKTQFEDVPFQMDG
eukprot:gnl/Chilomastix_caulleri/2209.p1 GENE.gnl/Chilomastix_caulleri/2209~~gnl/Chilomastix_caulleri/2209.p1  ORF type:complete len:156 (+),score=30.99 gnl/Chilomastix_caulleri/2209:102-569(+)